ncbi:LacI family DNA-binding transcriptional regulator [Acerihabitans sp. KWT182]|uniref:LacI family DNA-binding transcriptional regulator n=1 Tax=Acerihabitans sp. KWT182 TaxID=3157919 RepID=A0AAU7QAZ5_9GAMM
MLKSKASLSRVRVKDVAKAAGVSVATVSRSFNLPHDVRPDLRDNVLKIAAEMGYIPNSSAKALRLQKTNVIGAIIPTLDHSIYASMINSFQRVLGEYGYVVYILTCGFDSRHIYEKVKLLSDRGAEALLIVGEVVDPQLIEYLEMHRLPVVCAYSYHKEGRFPFIGFDNYGATQKIVKYLLGLGHRNLAMVTGPMAGNDRQQSRYQAFVDTLSEHKGCLYITFESAQNYTIDYGVNIMRKIHSEHPEVTAVICNSDVIAMGVLSACRKLNISVPDQLSVVGYDNLEFASHLEPPLTTLAIPAEAMGIQSAEALIARLHSNIEVRSQQLETELIIRGSSQ